MLVLLILDCVDDGAIVDEAGATVEDGVAVPRRVVSEGKARSEVVPLRFIQAGAIVGFAAEDVLNERKSGGAAGSACALRHARGEVAIEGKGNGGARARGGHNLCDGLEPPGFIGDREVLPVDAVGKSERGCDLPGVADVDLGLVVAVAPLIAGGERKRLAGGIVIEVLIDLADTTEAGCKGRIPVVGRG